MATTASNPAESHPRIPTGLDLFDKEYGGLPIGETNLICGGKGTGKLPIALQFLNAGLAADEKVVLVSSFSPEEILGRANAMELDFEKYLDSSQLILLEQKTQNPGIINSEEELNGMMNALESDIIPWEPKRLAICSAIPFIGLFNADFRRIAIPSVIRRFNRLGLTTVLTTLMPASSESMAVRKTIEDLCGASLHLDEQLKPDGQNIRRMAVRKLRGVEAPYPVYEFEVESTNRVRLIRRFDVALSSPTGITPQKSKSAIDPIKPKERSLMFSQSSLLNKSLEKKSDPTSTSKPSQSPSPAPEDKPQAAKKPAGFSFRNPGN
jgi:KaiC/GvpD/RAD55 family RecA-like ATPase